MVLSERVDVQRAELWTPLYRASFPEAFTRFWKKYLVFEGRASRSEFWWWTLLGTIVLGALILLFIASGVHIGDSLEPVSRPRSALLGSLSGAAIVIWGFGTVIPSFALLARRLHDANLSAWMLMLVLAPFIGVVAILVMTVLPPRPKPARAAAA